MSSASIGVVEALKDQGVCRWNHALRSAQQHLRAQVRSLSQANKLSSSSTPAMVSTILKDDNTKQSEESLKTVMYLSYWVLTKQYFFVSTKKCRLISLGLLFRPSLRLVYIM